MSILLPPTAETSERSLFRSLDWFTLAFLGFIWVAYGVWVHSYQQSFRQAAERELDRQRGIVTESMRSVLSLARFFLAGIDIWIADHPERDPRSDPTFLQYVEAFERSSNHLMVIRLVEADGTLHLVQKDRPEKTANVSDRDYFAAAKNNQPGELFISRPFQGRITGHWQIGVATRLTRPSHGAIMVVVAIETSLFEETFANLRVQNGGLISILRNDGILLARSSNTRIPLGIDLSASPLFQQGLLKSEKGFVETSSLLTDRTPRLLAYCKLKDYPLVVNVGTSLEMLRQTSLPALFTVAGFLAMLSVFTLLYRTRIRCLLNDLARGRAKLAEMAMLDQLTGIRNRRSFLEVFEETINRAKRYDEPLSLILLDVDYFKQVNDSFGHPAGDFALRELSRVCQECLRNVDSFGRLGGEEFGVLLPNTDIDGATELAKRICEKVGATEFLWFGLKLHLTVSLGVTELHELDADFADLYGRADKALYTAKESGRNRVGSLCRE